jgi:hypothetical protein
MEMFMKQNIDNLIHNKKSLCNKCPFCLSRCLKCSSIDITVSIQNDGNSFKYRNIFKNQIYLNKIPNRIFSSNIKKGIILSCNKCGNTIKAIDLENGYFTVLKTYDHIAPGKFLHGNSKYHIQLVKLYDLLDNFCHDYHLDDWLPCESVCLFFDETKISKKGKCPVQIERVLDIKSQSGKYSKGKITLKVYYLKEFGKYYTVIRQPIYYRNSSS